MAGSCVVVICRVAVFAVAANAVLLLAPRRLERRAVVPQAGAAETA